MGSLFLSRDLEETLRLRCVATLDRWSASIPFSVLQKLGSQTDFVSGTELAAYTVTVTTQIEERRFVDHEVPFRGQTLPSVLRSKDDYDLWKLAFRRYADFASHSESIDLADTRRTFTCPRCHGGGRIDCPNCLAGGWLRCKRCDSDGRPGWVKHDACGGQGKIRKTRTVVHSKRCGCRNRGTCSRCKGKGTVKVEEKQTYFEPCRTCRDGYERCGGCPEREGWVRCPTCAGNRQVTCPRCEGRKQLLSYVTAEKREAPTANAHQQIPAGLPQLRKPKGLLSNLQGPLVFTQDEPCRVAELGFLGEPAEPVLSAAVERCRGGHAGHVLRQRIEIARCSLVEYRYRHDGTQYSVYVNPAHHLVEDLDGPIQSQIGNLGARAAQALGSKRFEEAYRHNLRSLCMDGATPSEKELRNKIFFSLAFSYGLWALLVLLPASFAWGATARVLWRASTLQGALASLIPLGLSISLFARDLGLRFSGPSARIRSAALLGLGSFLSGAPLHDDSAGWPVDWTDYLPLGLLTLLLSAVWSVRFRERARRTRIEEQGHQFPEVRALEAYILGLEPSAGRDGRVLVRLLSAASLLAIAAGGVVYRDLSSPEPLLIAPLLPTPEARQAVRTYTDHRLGVLDVALTSDGRTAISGSLDRSIRIWDVASGATRHILQGDTDAVSAIAITRDDRTLISGSYDGTVRAWSIATGASIWIATPEDDPAGIFSLAVSGDGSKILVGGFQSLRILDLRSGQLLSNLGDSIDSVFGVAISPGGARGASLTNAGTVQIWDLQTARPLLQLKIPNAWSGCHDVTFTPDERTLLTACSSLVAWDASTGRPLRTISEESFEALRLTPDPSKLLVSGMGRVALIDARDGRVLVEFKGHAYSKYVNAIAVSRDGSFAVSASDDATLKVWKLGPLPAAHHLSHALPLGQAARSIPPITLRRPRL